MAGKVEQGRAAAEEAGHLAERLHYPVGRAAALAALATTAEDSGQVLSMMLEARELWRGLGRPVDAALCDLLMGHQLIGSDEAHGREALERAAKEFDELGVAHLAEWARAVPA